MTLSLRFLSSGAAPNHSDAAAAKHSTNRPGRTTVKLLLVHRWFQSMLLTIIVKLVAFQFKISQESTKFKQIGLQDAGTKIERSKWEKDKTLTELLKFLRQRRQPASPPAGRRVNNSSVHTHITTSCKLVVLFA